MPLFTKESLERLRQRVDLPDLLAAHIELKRAGSGFKALCPFHEEKSPSFVVQKGDTHYHCFGCGAHGDAIQFLMSHLKMSFTDAVESLAQRFQVTLDYQADEGKQEASHKPLLKKALEQACELFHYLLLHGEEREQARAYLAARAIDSEFITDFQMGLAPAQPAMLRKLLHSHKIGDEIMEEAGLILPTASGRWRDFFIDRITIPIRDAQGSVIGFTARKYREETQGGKYVNTPETPLFKKSQVLFGLHYCRRRIAKERKAIVVEGQLDALRMIREGFNITVAGQGTAFGEGHAKSLLQLGVHEVYLALDGDNAGQEAAVKIGHIFQKAGAEVYVVPLPPGSDPDGFLRQEGAARFLELLQKGEDYLTFLIHHLSKNINLKSPAAKNELITGIASRIREWGEPVMVHESLRKLAHLTGVPPETVLLGQSLATHYFIRKGVSVGTATVDADRVLEGDLLRWLLLVGRQKTTVVEWIRRHLQPDQVRTPVCRRLYEIYLEAYSAQRPLDLLALAIDLNDGEAQEFLSELLHKRVNLEKAEEQAIVTIQRILDREWMLQREEIRQQIQSGQHNEDEALALAKKFDALGKTPPRVKPE